MNIKKTLLCSIVLMSCVFGLGTAFAKIVPGGGTQPTCTTVTQPCPGADSMDTCAARIGQVPSQMTSMLINCATIANSKMCVPDALLPLERARCFTVTGGDSSPFYNVALTDATICNGAVAAQAHMIFRICR